MPDLFDELDAFASDQGHEPTPEPASDSVTQSDGEGGEDGVFGTGLTLEDLMNSDSKFVSDFGKELAGLKQAREERQAREKVAMEAEAAIEGLDFDKLDLTDPAIVAPLLALVERRRADASRIFEAGMRSALKMQGYSEDVIAEKMAVELAANRAAVAAMGDFAIGELSEYQAWERAKAERERARDAAIDMRMRMAGPGFEADLEVANLDIGAALDEVISRG